MSAGRPLPFEASALARALAQLEAAGLELPPEELAEALGGLERVKALLWLRLSAPRRGAEGPDQLLTAEEAGKRLGIAADTLYKKARSLPFTVRLGHQVRFSAAGIERFIASRQGKR